MNTSTHENTTTLSATEPPRIDPPGPCLPGFEDTPSSPNPRAINDYLALRPDDATISLIRQRLGKLWGRRGAYDSPLFPRNLHVSLHGFGSDLGFSNFKLEAAREAAASVVAAPFVVTFDRTESFAVNGFKKPFVLLGRDGLSALEIFQQRLGAAMNEKGLRHYVAHRFTPHMTLLYSPQMSAACRVEPISWTVRDFVLLRSFPGQSRQIELGRWALRG